MSNNISISLAFVLYLGLMMMLGTYFYNRTRNMSDYILDDRKLSTWVTSIRAEASNMSGWMLMGLSGYAYMAGLSAGWISLGLALGTWANWQFVAARLRKYTELADNILTLPDFFQNRFHDKTKLLRIIPAIFILIFFIIYTSAGFVAGGKLLNTIFGISYTYAMFLGAFVVIFYTLAGGSMTVCWTDFIQGVMMFFAIIIVPLAAIYAVGGFTLTYSALYIISPEYFNPFHNADGSPFTFIKLISLLGWGLGYFGQPHIFVRFMTGKYSSQIKQTPRIAMTWIIFFLAAAILVGMVGKVFLITALIGSDSEKVFIVMTDMLFSPFFAGLILAAVLAAIMSIASSQLLVAASAFTQDFYKVILHKKSSETELIWIGKLSIIIISVIAIYLGLNPNNLILDRIAYAWAGFGAAFGPALLTSLFWRRTTRNGVLSGILVGGLTVLIWKQFTWLDLYEMVPAFFFSLFTIYIVSKLDNEPAKIITDMYDTIKHSKI